ncbi:hypothetical protein O181_017816 [Austropuccinia psidii MF-1]|uniref:Uncharacterized protein n=1 Tax=Austropuccinia psidii MF-1 TaxID=1389203 RepID=A0A9Q3C8C6_9BASI|nr:hypothetical protein [Austropuccinia psidii MF-1]
MSEASVEVSPNVPYLSQAILMTQKKVQTMSDLMPQSTSNCGLKPNQLISVDCLSQPPYPLDDPGQSKQLEFFKKATGIEDSEELKAHIIRVREKAYKIFPYPCIWVFDFLNGNLANHFFYPQVRELAQKQPDKNILYVDLGSFLGIDSRQVIHDGWDSADVLAVDIIAGEFLLLNELILLGIKHWQQLGYELFRDAHKPIPFFLGNILEEKVLDSQPLPISSSKKIDLSSIKDLNGLKSKATFVSTSNLFHLFNAEDQRELAKRCFLLLDEQRGSTIFGVHIAGEKERFSVGPTRSARF